MNERSKKALKLVLKLLLSVGAVFIILRKVDFSKTLYYFGEANIWLLVLAFFAFFVSKLISSFRLNEYFRTQGLFLSNKFNYKLYLAGMFYSLFIPLIGGDGYKVIWLKNNYGIKVKKLVWASLLDRLSGIAGLTALAMLLFGFISFKPENWWAMWLLILPMYGAHFLFMHWVFKKYNTSWLKTSWQSLVVQLFQVLCTYFILLSMGIQDNAVDYLFIFLLSTYAYVLPIIGAREMIFVYGASYMGLDPELSLAIGIIFYISLSLNSLIGAYFLYKPLQKETLPEAEIAQN